MRLALSRRLLPIAGLALFAAPAWAASEAEVNGRIKAVLGDDAARYETMIKTFQQAVIVGSKEDVAAFVRYPIKVKIAGRKVTIRSPKEFVRRYDAIMSPDVVEAVASQKYEDLFVNSDGIMFGNGEIWINGICHDRKCSVFVPEVVIIQHTDD